jgi:hypothetical protein
MAIELGALGADTVLAPSDIQSMPLSAAFVNVNTSQFYGGVILDIDVSEIVQEIISKSNWDGGDDIGFMILGAPDETRFFYDYLGDPNRAASLLIHWGHVPTPPPGGGEFNETNRGFNIWVIDNWGVNRTGEPPAGDVVNWNTLNMTELTEQDSGASITRNNDTWTSLNTMVSQEIDSLYNDTGGGINHFFSRFVLNITGVTNTQPGTDIISSPTGISTASPNGANGLAYGAAGDWAGLITLVNADDQRWRLALRERAGVADWVGETSQWFEETANQKLYIEFKIDIVNGVGGFMRYGVWADRGFTQLIDSGERSMSLAINSMRYPQMVASLSSGTSRWNNAEYFTYLTSPLALNETWIVTYPNGTILDDDLDTYEDALTLIDVELGPDPTDPDPPSQGWDQTGPFSRFSMRLYILLIGFLMVFGPMWVWSLRRPTGYVFVIGAFIMLIGFALMYAAGQV